MTGRRSPHSTSGSASRRWWERMVTVLQELADGFIGVPSHP